MKIQIIAPFIFILILTNNVLAQQTFYASPNGSGTDCTLGSPCSLEGARNKVRTVNDKMTGDIVVKLMPGIYTRTTAFDLEAQDSGSYGFSVIYQSNDTSNPAIISGGQQISGWIVHDVSNNIYKASIGSSEFRQLYVNGTMATRARTPNTTDNKSFGPYHKDNISVDLSTHTVSIPSYQINNWKRLSQIELVMMSHWYHLRLRIASFTKNGTVATITPMEPEKSKAFNKPTDFYSTSFYYFENAYEFLDTEGEWYLNTEEGMVYYKPRFNEDMASAEVFVPSNIETLMTISGSAAPAHHIQVQGIHFEYTTWMTPSSNGTSMTQGNQVLSGLSTSKIPTPALKVENVNNIRLERNVFSKLGGVGVDLYRSVNNSQFIGNVLYDIAGNGLVLDIKSARNPAADKQLTDVLVANNFITRVGRNYSNAQGILAGFVKNVTIEHNEISDFGYSGMQIGDQSGNNIDVGMENNLIRYNEVHNVVQQHDDGGGIYTLARQPGTRIFENWVYDIKRGPWASTYAVAGIYLDNYSEYITIERNVVQDNSMVIYEQTGIGAKNNTCINNDIQDQSVKDNAGLELAYETIKNIVPQLPSLPTPPSFRGPKVEAEDMALVGATVEIATIYTNGQGVKPNTFGGNIGEASFTFSGISGAYDITVGYIKENVGQALHKLYVNGTEVDSWTATQTAIGLEFETRTANNIKVNNGDVVKITGKLIDSSYGRMDYMELSPPTPSIKVEAEDMILVGATVEKMSAYSNLQGAKPSVSGSNIGEASFTFTEISGTYDITVGYIKEDDGQALHKLYVNGTEVDSWIAELAGSGFELATRTSSSITVNNGDVVKITGKVTGGSHGRMDYIKLSKTIGPLNVNEELTTQKGLTVYPNPAQKNMPIVLISSEIIITLRLIDISGALIREFEVNDYSTTINPCNLIKGLYIVSITTINGSTSNEKLIIL